MKQLLCLAVLYFAVTTSYASQLLITDVKILNADEQITGPQDILVKDGRISKIGSNLTVGDDVEIFNGTGMRLSSGFFNANTELGLREVGAVTATVDSSSINERITASLRVADAINPSSVLLPHNRMLGLTHALVTPSAQAGLFAGTAAIIKLSETGTVVKSAAGMVVQLGAAGSEIAGGSRAAAMAQLREAFEDARDYRANKASYNSGQRRAYRLSRHDLEALLPVLDRKLPLIVYVDRAADIRRVIDFAKANKIRIILAGVEEGWRVAEQIAAQQIAVIIDPINNLPSSYETLGSRLDNAKILHDAGVTLLFTGMSWHSTHNAYLVRQSAGNAVANGLPYAAALAAVTTNPAKVFGISGVGDIKVGAAANLVLWSGDPFEPSTTVEKLIMDGRDQPLVSRATRLRERYFSQLK